MTLKELLIKNRSYRRFYQNQKIIDAQLLRWIDNSRYAASGRNAQPLKYIRTTSESQNAEIFSTLQWAGYLQDWDGPEDGHRPVAYIIQVLDTSISEKHYCDDGIAAQNILLSAVEEGFGGCILRAFNRNRLNEILKLDDQYQIINVLALGKPAEKVVIDTCEDGNIKYWRDNEQVHHVPKRPLESIVIGD